MKPRYERRIRGIAERRILARINYQLTPFELTASCVQDEIKEVIQQAKIGQYDESTPKENWGTIIQEEAVQLSEPLINTLLAATLPHIEKLIAQKHVALEKKLQEHRRPKPTPEENLAVLWEFLEQGKVYAAGSNWRGADVVISDVPIARATLGWTHQDDLVVITHDYKLAKQISWMMLALRQACGQYINYINKYRFYGEIAETAKNAISDYADAIDIAKLMHATALEFVQEIKPFIPVFNYEAELEKIAHFEQQYLRFKDSLSHKNS